MILVAVRDAPQRESLRAALHREGWQVSVVGSLDSAYRMAADQAPQLVVLDAELPGSDELVKVFARGHGGPGILLLADAAAHGRFAGADAVVGRQVAGDELVASVRTCLAAPRPVTSAPPVSSGQRRWTAEELFGEILEDLDAAVSAVEAAAPAEPEETPAALARGTVPAETLAASAVRPRGRKPVPPPVAVQPAVEEDVEEVVEAVEAAPEPAPVASESLPTPAPPASAPEEFEEPPLASALELALAGETDRTAPRELEALAEELLGSGRPRRAVATESPVAEEPGELPGEPAVAEEAQLAAAPPEPASLAGSELQVGPYRLLERLGSREAVEIWQATREEGDGESAATVTVEVSRGLAARRPELAVRALAAAEQAATLDHPTILAPLDAGLAGDDLFIATESLSATSLERLLASVRTLEVRIPLGLALGMGERVATALEHAHGALGEAVVHGALRPEHVLVTRGGEVRVAGFAVTSVLESADAAPADQVRYRAPERVAGEPPEARGDLYSFGAVLFEMVTGRPAFGGEDAAAVGHAIQHDAPDPPDRLDPTIPSEVSGLIARLLKRRREERVQGASEAQRKLDLALQALPSPPGAAELAAWIRQLEEAMRHARPRRTTVQTPTLEAPAPAPEKARLASAAAAAQSATARRRRWLVAALLAAGLALGAVAYWLGRERGGPRVITVPPPAPRPASVLAAGAPSVAPALDEAELPEASEVPPPAAEGEAPQDAGQSEPPPPGG